MKSATKSETKSELLDSSHLKAHLMEGATKKIVQGGMHGPGARVAGAAAAVGCEAYRLYGEVQEKSEQLRDNVINKEQYTEGVTMCSVAASGRAMGGLAGAALGQASIPIPVVGAVIGGVAGAVVGGVHSETFAGGIFRLTGGKAKADENVRCIEHKSNDQPVSQSECTYSCGGYNSSSNLSYSSACVKSYEQPALDDDEE